MKADDDLCGHHATVHGGVAALDLGHVEEARTAAHKRTAGEGQLGDGLGGRVHR